MGNQTILQRVLLNTRQLSGVPHLRADEMLQVRDLPYTTFLNLLIDVFEETRKETDEIRAKIYMAVKEIADQGENIQVSNKDLEAFFGFALPLIFRAVTRLPHSIETILRDVVVDAEGMDLSKLPIETSVFIVAATFDRVDLELMAREITRVFSKAAMVTRGLPSMKSAALPS